MPPHETAERWLPVSGWEGMYEVSDRGRVRSLERAKTWRGREVPVSARILRQWTRGDGTGTKWAWVPGAVPGDGRRHRARGTASGSAKLTPEIVREARARSALGESSYALAAEYGVAQSTLWAAIRGHTWKEVA